MLENENLINKGEKIPVINGIPRFVDSSNYASAFGNQCNRFQKTQLDSSIGFNLSEDRVQRCFGKHFNDLSGKQVLEASCGAGWCTEILLKANCKVVSIDLSSAVEANQRNFPQNENHQICQADISNLPFPEKSFDVVICLDIIQHTRSSKETIESLFKHVKPGGVLVIDHYKPTLSFLIRLLPVYRLLFKLKRPKDTLKFSEKLVKLWFPLHKLLGKNVLGYALLTRFSPIVSYFHLFPKLNESQQFEWSILDTHDSLF